MRYVTIGQGELLARFLALSEAVRRRILRVAGRKAMVPVNKRAKQLCPREMGLLKKSIGIKVKTYPTTGTVWVGVGPRIGAQFEGVGPDGKKRVPVRYAHLVERGTRHSPAQPFMRPAMDEKRNEINAILKREVWREIVKAAKKR